jgi:dephospho-CoA kinase
MTKTGNRQGCLRVGVTGGIGSGKSLVCRIFAAFGIPVYDADYWAKWLITEDLSVKTAITQLFGHEAYLPDGAYNRRLVASIVFSDKGALEALNNIVHPALAEHSMAWHIAACRNGAPYTIKEAAIMVESGMHRALDVLVVVTAPEALRIQRTIERDGVSEAAVRDRIASQMPESEKLALADHVIVNDGKHSLLPQIWQIHQGLLKQSAGPG